MSKKIIDLLYRSFDATLTDDEQLQLKKALSQSSDLQKLPKQIQSLRQTIAKAGSFTFKPFFAERVMSKINVAPSRITDVETYFDSLFATFKPVAIAVVIILFSLLTFNLTQTRNFTLAGALGEKKVILEEMVDPFFTLTMER